MKSMKKKMLSVMAVVSALAPVSKSFAADKNDKVSYLQGGIQFDKERMRNYSKNLELLEKSIESMKKLTAGRIMEPVITAEENGDVFASKNKWRLGGPGGDRTKIGENFIVSKSALADWLRYDRGAVIDSWYHLMDQGLIMKGLKKWTNVSTAVIHRNLEQVKKQGLYDECVRQYIRAILDSEFEKAEEQIKKQKDKIKNSDENFEEGN